MRRSSSQSRCHMRNAPLPGYPSSRITSAALCPYRSHNPTARLRCSLEYLAMMTTPPAQGVQHSVTTSKHNRPARHRMGPGYLPIDIDSARLLSPNHRGQPR